MRRRLATDRISRIVIRYGILHRPLGFPAGGLAMCLAVDGKQTFTLNLRRFVDGSTRRRDPPTQLSPVGTAHDDV